MNVKRISALLLALLLCLPACALAKTVVTTVDITFPEPVIGEAFDPTPVLVTLTPHTDEIGIRTPEDYVLMYVADTDSPEIADWQPIAIGDVYQADKYYLVVFAVNTLSSRSDDVFASDVVKTVNLLPNNEEALAMVLSDLRIKESETWIGVAYKWGPLGAVEAEPTAETTND